MIPHTTPTPAATYSSASIGRFASRIITDPSLASTAKAALIGLPDDTGVRMNSGRPGAAGGPAAFRTALARYGAADPHLTPLATLFDAGDVIPGATLAETHDRVTAAVEVVIALGLVPIGIGGGHDLTFAFARAACRTLAVTSGLYLDAHLDVRAEAGSGMPMRALIESCGIKQLRIVGFEPLVNSAEHTQWFLAHGGEILTPAADTIARASAHLPTANCFVSIDLDAMDASQCPGVSAINPQGLWTHNAACYAYAAGACDRVKCFDIMELNPAHDTDPRTARVAAMLLLRFLAGLAQR